MAVRQCRRADRDRDARQHRPIFEPLERKPATRGRARESGGPRSTGTQNQVEQRIRLSFFHFRLQGMLPQAGGRAGIGEMMKRRSVIALPRGRR